jgi:hypothetical protein
VILNDGDVFADHVSHFFKYTNNKFIDQDLLHNHNCDSEKILNRQILNNNLKRKSQDDIC